MKYLALDDHLMLKVIKISKCLCDKTVNIVNNTPVDQNDPSTIKARIIVN